MKQQNSDRLFEIVNATLLVMVLVVMIYPLYFTIIASISDPSMVATGQVTMLPRGVTVEAYQSVFRDQRVWTGYRNAIVYSVFGTLFSVAMTIPAAFVLSRKTLPGRGLMSWYFLVPMFFTGGLVPTYLIVRNLGLLNHPTTLIILNGLSVWLLVISRIYYESNIPAELHEAATIDGCSDFQKFWHIVIPLSAPIIAVVSLFYAVARWNDFFSALIYLSDSRLYPLQLVLRNILLENQLAVASLQIDTELGEGQLLAQTRRAYLAEAMKYALIFIASAPLLVAYPFVQKHFVKGVMIGSLKG